MPPDSSAQSAWAPLRVPVYRRLWIAQVVSNLGTWVQTVGAQWELVRGAGGAALVALVQTASTLPAVLLAAPAGVLADVLDRRRLLVAVQLSMVVVATVLAGLTFAGDVDPYVVLAFTFLPGSGAAFIGPAWQAIQPELGRRPGSGLPPPWLADARGSRWSSGRACGSARTEAHGWHEPAAELRDVAGDEPAVTRCAATGPASAVRRDRGW